ncbi:MAG: DUF3015 family protein [Nitrospirae bacterium]|nr:DUF3015 family protein [Candidatus Manganitrophaceae bacterium]
MRKLPVIAVAMVLALTVVSSALAAGYGAAGCGWGGKVIKQNDQLSQLGAWLLNGVSSNQTFAMTSGTSGCSKLGIVMAEAEQTQFVESNYQGLAKEMASGEGENIYTLAGLLGCSAEQTKNFASFTKQNYDSIFKSEQNTPSEMLASLKEGLSNDPVLATSCQKI